MPADQRQFATVSLAHLEDVCKSALISRGASEEEASLVFKDYLDCELRGRPSHGLMAFNLALREFPIKGHSEIVAHSDTFLRIKANGACGHVVARRAIDLALPKLGQSGFTLVGIQASTRFNSPGPIARYAAERGLIAVVLYYGGENLMAPPGGKNRALSTNPIGIGIPLSTGMTPFVLDIATSEHAMGCVSLAKLLSQDIPTTWGVNSAGQATTNPNEVFAVRPFAGHKGFGLGLAIEILVGPLLGVPIGVKGSLGSRGTLMLLIHPTAFGEDKDTFLQNASSFLKDVKASDDQSVVSYPGEVGEQRYRKAMEAGSISVPVQILKKLEVDIANLGAFSNSTKNGSI